MALTGRADEPFGPPDGLVDGVEAMARAFGDLDGLALLGERAAHMGLWRRGTTSCGGSCRLLPSRDGIVAVSLARAEDFDSVPAWLELPEPPATAPATWTAVAEAVASRDAGGADGTGRVARIARGAGRRGGGLHRGAAGPARSGGAA